ncbi:hypothetical protein RRG08_021428 [Elysia crispata]|uniref:Uncharacterized protein n=1 Tax=Elysia crispata TaxID=231223 RepID=A0AAE1A7R9_9GAST|nr:hypothetical protein RRG08_021428 [Elysia crispata]
MTARAGYRLTVSAVQRPTIHWTCTAAEDGGSRSGSGLDLPALVHDVPSAATDLIRQATPCNNGKLTVVARRVTQNTLVMSFGKDVLDIDASFIVDRIHPSYRNN